MTLKPNINLMKLFPNNNINKKYNYLKFFLIDHLINFHSTLPNFQFRSKVLILFQFIVFLFFAQLDFFLIIF